MKYITRITWDNVLKVEHGEIIGASENGYSVKFPKDIFTDFVYKPGYPVHENVLNRAFVQSGTWCNILYLSTAVYKEKPKSWQKYLINWRLPNDSRKWLRKTL